MSRSYSELITYHTLKERYKYLELGGSVGTATFGSERWLNQRFYKSKEWLDIRRQVIIRDDGCELGVSDYPIQGRILIHHLNPITSEALLDFGFKSGVLDPDNLICVSHSMHNAIHYGDENLLPKPFSPRTPGDTKLW